MTNIAGTRYTHFLVKKYKYMYFEGLGSREKGIIAISVTAAMSVSLGGPWAAAWQ